MIRLALVLSLLVAQVASAQTDAGTPVVPELLPAEEPAAPVEEPAGEEPAAEPAGEEPAAEPEPEHVPELLPRPEVEAPAPSEPEPRRLDPLEDADEHRIWLASRAELEIVDVEGAGGFRNRDTARVAPARRAAYVDLDKFTLDIYTRLFPWFLTRMELRADTDGARIDRVYLEVEPWDDALGEVSFQLGRQMPMIRPRSRRTETWSPQGSAFWRGREWHVGGDLRLRFDPVRLRAVLALALTRELMDRPMGEDPNLPFIAFGHTDVGEDSSLEGQALLGASVFGASVEAFGAIGEMLDNQGPDTLMRTFEAYALFGDDVATNRTSAWYGFRAFFDEYGVYVLGEIVFQYLGHLWRRGWEANASYTIRFDIDGHPIEIEPFFRYAQLTITNLPELFEVPETWDRDQIVVALLLRPFDQLEIKLEYLFLEERAGTSVEGMTSVADNQFLLQLRIETELGVLP